MAGKSQGGYSRVVSIRGALRVRWAPYEELVRVHFNEG